MRIRRIALATLAVAAVGLAACSSDKKIGGGTTTSSESTTTSSSSTIVTETTLPATTLEATTLPPATQPPATQPPATQPPATAPPGFSLYDQVSPPTVPTTHTDPFASSGVLGNGKYWVLYNGGETETPDITVVQAFFGAECVSKADEMGDECLNDIYVLNDPSRDIDDLPFAHDVFLTVADSSTQLSYWITPDELRQIRASSPSDGAPDGYGFAGFPWLMTVHGGQITKFEQVWVP